MSRNKQHSQILAEQTHVSFRWKIPTVAELPMIGLTIGDLNKEAYIEDISQKYILKSIDPVVWEPIKAESNGIFSSDIFVYDKTIGRSGGNISTNLVLGAHTLESALPVSEANPNSGYNCVFGDYAAQYLQTGWGNNIQGAAACQYAGHIQDTNALGNNVLWKANTVNASCAFGAWAGWKLDAPAGVVAFGAYTFDSVVSANYSVALGFLAHANADFTLSGAIGAFATPTADKQIRIGRGDVSVSVTDIISTSDENDKIDIESLPEALCLEIVKRLNPVSYRRNARSLYRKMVEYTDAEGKKRYKIEKTERDGSKAGKRRHWGFIAQDVEKISQELNIDIAAFKRSTIQCEDGTEEDFCELDYLQVIPALTKALQKALAEIELLKQSVATINNNRSIK